MSFRQLELANRAKSATDLDLFSHGLEIPLHPTHTDRDRIDERERLSNAWQGLA